MESIKDQIEKLVCDDFNKGRPTFISMTSAYFPNSAGIMSHYKLSEMINRAGYNSFMVLWKEWEKLNPKFVKDIEYKSLDGVSMFLPKDFAIELCHKYNCIAIYTDHDEGNPLNAKIVAR